MREVQLLSVELEGFGSFVDRVHFQLDRGGVVMIGGVNGVGKTTLFSGLAWTLYGSDLKGNSLKDLQSFPWLRERAKKFRGTRGIVVFKVTDKGVTTYVQVARNLGFSGKICGYTGSNDLFVFENQEGTEFLSRHLWADKRGKSGANERIQELLGMDFKMFTYSVLFGQSMDRLVTAKPEDKRKLFEQIFDLDFIDAAKVRANRLLEQTAQDALSDELFIAKAETQIESLQTSMEQWTEIVEKFHEDLKEELDGLKAEKKALEATITKNEAELNALRKVDASRIDRNALMQEAQKLKDLETEVRSIKSAMNKNADEREAASRQIERQKEKLADAKEDLASVPTQCGICGKDVTTEENDALIKKYQDAIKDAKDKAADLKKKSDKLGLEVANDKRKLHAAEARYAGMYEAVSAMQQEMDKFEDERKAISKVETEIAVNTSRLSDVLNRMKSCKDKQPPDVDLKAMQQELDSKVALLAQKTEDFHKFSERKERLTWWVKKAFGAAGIKAFVFNRILEHLNELAHKYAVSFGMSVVFSIDMEKASKPFLTQVYMNGQEVPYSTLSGGQKQRVNVVLAFAMYDMVADVETRFNILMMDEMFEGMDEEGMEVAFDIIRKKTGEDMTIYVVSHREVVDTLNTKFVSLKLVNGKTILREGEEHT